MALIANKVPFTEPIPPPNSQKVSNLNFNKNFEKANRISLQSNGEKSLEKVGQDSSLNTLQKQRLVVSKEKIIFGNKFQFAFPFEEIELICIKYIELE